MLFTVFAVPVAFTQTIEVASCDTCKREPLAAKPPPHILIRAKCAFPDGTIVDQKLIEVEATLSAQRKREIAEQACQPILDAANAKCDAVATQVDAMKSEWRIAAPHSAQESKLLSAIKATLASAPAYCK